MSDAQGVTQGMGNPYKIVDHTRERRKGITASSLKELTNIARSRLALPVDADLTIVLEQDGKQVFPSLSLLRYMRLMSMYFVDFSDVIVLHLDNVLQCQYVKYLIDIKC